MSWNDVEAGDKKRASLSGRFVAFEDAVAFRFRVLDEDPFTTRVHKISQPVEKGGKTEEVFRSIPATENPDENYVLKMNGTRYPDVQQFNLRVAQFKKDAGGQDTDDYELKILQGGPAIFKPLAELFKQYGHLNKFDVTITRKGKGRDTEYTVTAAPFSKTLDVQAAMVALAADEGLNDWRKVFPVTTAEDQMKMIKEAGFDITYDPAAQIAASMTQEEAAVQEITFGKYKGKKVGEIAIIDSGYLAWAADNVTSNDKLAAACRVMIGGVAKIANAESVTPAALPAAKAPSPAAAPASKEDGAERKTLIENINDQFEQNPKFEDLDVMIGLVKKHGGGKTKVKDLTVTQLRALNEEITSG